MDPARYLDVPTSGELVDRHGEPLYAFLNDEDHWCFARPLDAFSPWLVQATIAAEDQRFRRHFGVDPWAVARAVRQNISETRVASGASTLTMQVVKRGLPEGRSWWGKAVQAVEALRLERRLSKDEILALYLNTAPYGLNLMGAEAASLRYFGKSARELSLAEAALLAGLPKAPTRLMPLRQVRQARDRRNYVLRRMLDEGNITENERAEAEKEPIRAAWHDFAAVAPHVAMRCRKKAGEQGRLAVTIDRRIQERAEWLVRYELSRYAGITNGAAIVIEVPTASVLAYVGSGDFFDTPGGGQVDACMALRSPGSALKPFTYALAMERNLLYPGEMMLDDSLDYGVFATENFDGTYNGLTTATTALRQSLNVPAVTILERLGAEPLFDLLRDLGVSTLAHGPEHYGLGLTLGDCEVRLRELAGAYCALANLGEYRPLRVMAEDAAPAKRLLSRGVCVGLFTMLEQALPLESEVGRVRARGVVPRVCWKTGTSSNHRDAWAFVFNQQYVVGVWMGNNNGAPCSELVGADTALPLAAGLFRGLAPNASASWPAARDDLREVRVCAKTGLPVSRWCTAVQTVLLPREQLLHRVCDVHCPGGTEGGAAVVERWPGSARGWDLANVESGLQLATRGSVNRDAESRRLRILQPPDRAEFVLTGEEGGDRVRLESTADGHGEQFWYCNDRFLGASTAGSPVFLDLTAGVHRLACMDSAGMVDTVQFSVARPAPQVRFAAQ